MSRPTLRTDRLVLRPFSRDDAPRVQELAGLKAVASMTVNIPHPYEDGMAEAWIEGHESAWEERERLVLAITTEAEGLVGAIGLHMQLEHRRGELGYWIGAPFWNRGYATEAARAVLDYGFGELGLHRIMARHFPRNPASGAVLTKLGMMHEGTMRGHVVKDGRPEDLECYAVLEEEWRAARAVTVEAQLARASLNAVLLTPTPSRSGWGPLSKSASMGRRLMVAPEGRWGRSLPGGVRGAPVSSIACTGHRV